MQTALSITERPLLSEARNYCERYGIESLGDLEQVRLSMCVRELRERMQPWFDTLAKMHPATYSLQINAPLPKSYLEAEALVKEIQQQEADKLGLTSYVVTAGTPEGPSTLPL